MSEHDTREEIAPSVAQARFLRFSLDVLAGRVMRALTLMLSFAALILVMLRPHWVSLVGLGMFVGATLPVWWRKERG